MSLLTSWVGGAQRVNAPEFDDGVFSGFYRSVEDARVGSLSFEDAVRNFYAANGIVFACIGARAMPFSEARFQFQDMTKGRPGKLYGNQSLSLIESPWPNGTTGELLFRMEQDASLFGNFYATIVGEGENRRVRRLRPDLVTVVTGVRKTATHGDRWLDAEILGYSYRESEGTLIRLAPEDVVHYSPIPDPLHSWRGMSWLTPLIREINADSLATTHKLKYFENGASLSTVMKYPQDMPPELFKQYVALFEESHAGPANAYRTLHVGGGADPTVISSEMKSDFRAIQAAGENRVAAAAGVGAVMARFTDGLSGSSLNEGNYKAAKRQFADMTLRPLWRQSAAALAKLVGVPAGSRLWYDVRDVELLKENEADEASIVKQRADTIAVLVNAGFTPDSATAAVEASDLTLLVHSGLASVQLQPIGADPPGGIQP